MKIHQAYNPKNDPDLRAELLRKSTPKCVVIHTTGYGKGFRHLDAKLPQDRQVDDAYAHRLDRVLRYKAELGVGRTGKLYEFTDWRKYFAYHTGSKNLKKLKRLDPPEWWKARHPGRSRVTELLCWGGGSVNRDSIGIDLFAPRGGGTSFSRPQRDALIQLVAFVTAEFGILINEETVIDHSSADPIERANARGPWDLPDNFDLRSIREAAKLAALEYGMDYANGVSR